MLRALDEYEIGGVTTLLGFHRALLSHPCFVGGATCHGIVESQELPERPVGLVVGTPRVGATAAPAGSTTVSFAARSTGGASTSGCRAGAPVRRSGPPAP